MDDSVILRLRDAVASTPPDLLSDSRRTAALVRDTVPGARLEANALVSAAEEGVPASLVAGMTPSVLRQRLAGERGLSPEVSDWAVRGWAIAIGLEPDELSGSPSDAAEEIWPRARVWIGMAGISALVMLLVGSAWDPWANASTTTGPVQVHITRVAISLTSLAALAAVVGLVRVPRWSLELAGVVAGLGLGSAAPVIGLVIAWEPDISHWFVQVLLAGTVVLSLAGIGMARAAQPESREVRPADGVRVIHALVAVAIVFALLNAVTFLSEGGTPGLGIPSLLFAALLLTLLLLAPRILGTRVTAGAMVGAGAAAVAEGLGVVTLPAVLEVNPLYWIPITLQSAIGVGVLPIMAGYFIWLHREPPDAQVAERTAVNHRPERARSD